MDRLIESEPTLSRVVAFALRQPVERRAAVLGALPAGAYYAAAASAQQNAQVAYTLQRRVAEQGYLVAKNEAAMRLASDGASVDDRRAAAADLERIEAEWTAKKAELVATRDRTFTELLIAAAPRVAAVKALATMTPDLLVAADVLEVDPQDLAFALGPKLPNEPMPRPSAPGLDLSEWSAVQPVVLSIAQMIATYFDVGAPQSDAAEGAEEASAATVANAQRAAERNDAAAAARDIHDEAVASAAARFGVL